MAKPETFGPYHVYRGHLTISTIYQALRITKFSVNRTHPSWMAPCYCWIFFTFDGLSGRPSKPRHIFEAVTSSVLARNAWMAVSQSRGSFLHRPRQNKYSRPWTWVEVKPNIRCQYSSKQGSSLFWSALRNPSDRTCATWYVLVLMSMFCVVTWHNEWQDIFGLKHIPVSLVGQY